MKKLFSFLLSISLLLTTASCQMPPEPVSQVASNVPIKVSSSSATSAATSSVPEVTQQTGPALPTQDIAILYTNDVHCAVNGEISYAGIAAYRKQLWRSAQVLLVDCGDSVQGAPIGTLSKGEDILTLMNALDYDVAIPGNHEFDYGMEQFNKLVSQAEFPYLSANFTNAKTGELVLPPYLIKEVANTKIAFVGVTTPLTITTTTPIFFQNEAGEFIYDFLADATGSKLHAAVQKAVDAARAEGADYVVLLAHLGIDNATSPFLSTSLIENTSGIDVVLDGHSHSVVESERVQNKEGKRVLLSQTGTALNAVGLLMINKRGELSTRLVSDITEKDTAMTMALDTVTAKLDAQLSQKVATTQNLLTVNDPATGVRIIRNAETNLGNLCADAYRATGKTEVAIINGGDIRGDLPAGDLTYGDILKVFPFSNQLCTAKVTGQQLLDALEHSVRAMPEENSGFLHVSGISFTVDPTIPTSVMVDKKGMFQKIEGVRRITNAAIAGQPIDPTRTYTLTGSSYLLKNGGDGYNMFTGSHIMQDEFMLDATAIIGYLAGDYPAKAATYANPYGEGRIVAAGK